MASVLLLMTMLEKLEAGLATRRAELINTPLARIWGELAKVCNDLYEQEARDAYERFTKMQVIEMDDIPKCITFNALVRCVHNASIESAKQKILTECRGVDIAEKEYFTPKEITKAATVLDGMKI